MSSVVISGDTSGAITLAAPAVAGTNTISLPANTGTVITTASTAAITQGMLATAASSIGVGQTWQDMSASRSAGVTYTNSTGKPIMVSIRAQTGTSDCSITVDGVQAALSLQTTATRQFLTVIVPNGSTYIMQPAYSALWAELR
jgi:hypothetical protein